MTTNRFPGSMSKYIVTLKVLFQSDSIGGILLLLAAILALILENTSAASFYHTFLHLRFDLGTDTYRLDYSLHEWINEGLMVLFFLLVGLEIKREFIAGQLANINYVLLPTFAAIGGILVPALIFFVMNYGTPAALAGWAVPTATDIAFAVGIIALFGKRLPSSVKLFVLTLAVLDDIGAIIIIAFFYADDLDVLMLFYSLLCVLCMAILNQRNVRSLVPYLCIGIVSWLFMLRTGIHPTLTGILIASCIPLRVKPDVRLPHAFGMDLGSFRLGYVSPAYRLEHYLHKPVMLFILPLFALVNSGLPLGVALSNQLFFTGISLGIFFGLFVGKPVGLVLGALVWRLMFRAGFPVQIDWLNFLAMSFICGIGYTMSLLIGTIAYPDQEEFMHQTLIGIFSGSLLAGLVGCLLFGYWLKLRAPASSLAASP